MRKKPTVIGWRRAEAKMKCPNCEEIFIATYKPMVLRGECWTCGYRFEMKKHDFDLIQPDSPLFELIYRCNPQKRAEMEARKKKWEEEKRKMELEEKYHKMWKEKKIKVWEKRDIENLVLKEE